MLTEDFTTAAAILSALPPETEATELVPLSFFVAWSGVLALVYDGFPPCLVGIKATLAQSLAVAPEKFGSLWPKTTLAALRDDSPLSLADLQRLRDLCTEHAAGLCQEPPVTVDSVSVVAYEQRGLERVRCEHRRPLKPRPAGAAAVRTAATFLLGRAFIETLHAWGLPAALRAPRAFGRAVALRRACSGAAVSSRLTSSPAGS